MMDEIKPVVWIEYAENGNARMWSGDLSAWAHRPANPEPLYDQPTIEFLLDTIHELRGDAERIDWFEANPNSISRSTGYRGADDSWALRRDGMVTEDFLTLREAIDAANPRYTITAKGRALLEGKE